MSQHSTGRFDFNNLFTFEMANNHQGSISHGGRIVEEIGAVAREFGLKAAMKVQFRDLETFIHPDYKDRKDVKHIPRFLSTKLAKEEFKALLDKIRAEGMITMATPFDETSVDVANELDVEILKVASASIHDWPLLAKIAESGKPVIISVGGISISDVDKVVSFFEHRGTHFAIMHCVAIYPTPSDKLYLSYIETLRERYPNHVIGFSTHESPDNTLAIALAYAKGARIFEKHVGVSTDTIKLNAYSANPNEVRKWIKSYKEAVLSCGEALVDRPREKAEDADLQSLKRGVFAKNTISKGDEITRDDIFFAMPIVSEDQLTSGEWKHSLVADRDYKEGEAIGKVIADVPLRKHELVYPIVHAVKGMLNNAKIVLSHDFQVEISHHYGLERFTEIGCVIIDCINREYAKKLVIQLPGQFHPTHYHKLKDETFQVLAGEMEVEVEGKKRVMHPGETLWVPRGVWHSFSTKTGVIFEEISTTANDASGDSYYIDRAIASMPRAMRKTRLMNWGRHQFDEMKE